MAQKITQALIYQELQTIKETNQRHTEALGELRLILEGSDAAPGMKIRLDRIEQREDSRKKQLGYLWSAVMLVLSGVVTLFTNQCTLPITTNSVPSISSSSPNAGSTSATEAK
jgi:hypothetical protein